MEEKVILSMLIQTYGKLLTEKQYQIMDDYYNNDLSLSEIAQNHNITRQAVRNAIIYEKDVKYRKENRKSFIRTNENTKRLFRQTNSKCIRDHKKRIKLFSII